MNTRVLITFVLFAAAFAVPGISFAQNIEDDTDKLRLSACPVGTSTDCDQSGLFHDAIAEPFSQSDSVAIGTVIQKESIGENSIAYSINVDFYLKNYQPFDLLTATLNDSPPELQVFHEVWYYNSPVFNKGDLVFVYLVKNDGSYELLPESFALDKQESRGPPPDIHLTKSPSEGTLLQGEKILVSGDVRKMELVKAAKNGERLDVELTLHRPYGESEIFFSDLIDIDADGHYNYHLDTSNISPGEYHLKVKYGPSSSSTDITIDFNSKYWSPLQQFKSGIPSGEVQCRESLTLVTKNNGFPACVKEQTLLKLVERQLIITSKAERDLMLAAGYKLYPGVGWVQGEQEKQLSPEPEPERDPVPEGNYVDKNTYVYSVKDAESYLNYTLSTPYLPEGTDLEKIKISSDRRKATIYYSNGLEVSHHPMGINFNNTHYIQNPEREVGKVFYDFAGTFAEGLEIDEPNRPFYSTIKILRDDRIYVRATMETGLDDLLKMIEPMDLNVPHVPYTPTPDYVMGAPEPEPIPEPEPENEN